jgi:hypothetical protein
MHPAASFTVVTMVCDLKITGMQWKTNHNSKRDKALRLLAKENQNDNVSA